MALIDDIVNVTITQADLGVNTASFNKLMILGKTKNEVSVKAYGSMSEVSQDYTEASNEYKIANLSFSQAVKPTSIYIGQGTTASTWVETYNAVKAINNDFYGVVATTKSAPNQVLLATAVEADVKIFGCSTNDVNVLNQANTSNLAYLLKFQGFTRSFCEYSSAADVEYPEAGVLGLMLSYDAGSANWAHRQIAGTTANDLTKSGRDSLSFFNCNSILKFAGRNVHFWGTMANGGYADILHGTDWLKSTIQDRVASVLQASLKVEYTNSGIAAVVSAIKSVLYQAADNNFLDKDTISVTAPLVANISTENKAARILPDVYFEAVTSGAINKVQVKGVLSV